MVRAEKIREDVRKKQGPDPLTDLQLPEESKISVEDRTKAEKMIIDVVWFIDIQKFKWSKLLGYATYYSVIT